LRVASGLVAALFWKLGASAAAPPIEAPFRDPVFSAAALAPDGRRVAVMVPSKGTRLKLAVLDLETMKPQGEAGDSARIAPLMHPEVGLDL